MQQPVNEEIKKCTRCKQLKPFAEFNKNAKHPDGLRRECRQCQSKQSIIDSEKRRARVRYYKFKAIYNGLTAVQKKIYEVTPIAQSWDVISIKMELARTSTPTESRVILGCLSGLAASGLVKEAPKGMFQRVPVDAKVESLLEKQSETQDKQPDNTEVMTKPKNQAAPIEKISKLTEKCKSILEMLKELSSDIETVAIEVQESFSDQGKDAEKLRQLQLLLKSIG